MLAYLTLMLVGSTAFPAPDGDSPGLTCSPADKAAAATSAQNCDQNKMASDIERPGVAGRTLRDGGFITRFTNGDRLDCEQVAPTGTCNGTAVYTFANGIRFRCEIVAPDDSCNGASTVTFVDGARFEGINQDNAWVGKATRFYLNGDTLACEAVAADGSCNGAATYTFANGNRYRGSQRNGEWARDGRYEYVDGSTREAPFEGGVEHTMDKLPPGSTND